MSIFNSKDTPSEVMAKVVKHGGLGYDGLVRKEGDLAIGKLRLVGAYDDRIEGCFMLRTRIPGGHLTVDQARVIGKVANEFSIRPKDADVYDDRFIEITTRQAIQIHWIKVDDLSEIWRMYGRVGLTSVESCGNTTRNIVSCPAHGLSDDEVIDTYPIVEEVNKYMLSNPEISAFLPRKFKIAITGSVEDCVLYKINDLAFTPAEFEGEVGFNVSGGGGLSDYPRIASDLNLFVSTSDVLEAVRACLSLFIDFGDYKHSAINRFRMLVSSMGVNKVRDELEKRASFRFRTSGRSLQMNKSVDHVGVYKQKQDGLTYVGLNVPVGRMNAKDIIEVADVSEKYGSHDLRLTNRQNIMIINVKTGSVDNLLNESVVRRFHPYPTPFKRGIVACTGAPLCKFGNSNTKSTGLEMAKHLDRLYKDGLSNPFQFTIHVSGCKASCAQLQIADIGLRASVAKNEESLEEAFDICLGGCLAEGRFAEWIAYAFPSRDINNAVERLIEYYSSNRKRGETLADFNKRVGSESIIKVMKGGSLKRLGGS